MWRKPSHWLLDWVFQLCSTSSWLVDVSWPVTSCVNGWRPNSGGSGRPMLQFRAKTAPLRTSPAAATTRSGVSMLRHPK